MTQRQRDHSPTTPGYRSQISLPTPEGCKTDADCPKGQICGSLAPGVRTCIDDPDSTNGDRDRDDSTNGRDSDRKGGSDGDDGTTNGGGNGDNGTGSQNGNGGGSNGGGDSGGGTQQQGCPIAGTNWQMVDIRLAEPGEIVQGETIRIRAQATNQLGKEVTQPATVPVQIGGGSDDTGGQVTFAGSGTAFDDNFFDVEVTTGDRLTVSVGCLSETFDVTPRADLTGNLQASLSGVPETATVGDRIQPELTMTCEGPGRCPQADISIRAVGELQGLDRIPVLSPGETASQPAGNVFLDSAGTVTVEGLVDGSVVVSEDVSVQSQDGGGARPQPDPGPGPGDGDGRNGSDQADPDITFASTDTSVSGNTATYSYTLTNAGFETGSATVEVEADFGNDGSVDQTRTREHSVAPGETAEGSFDFDVRSVADGAEVRFCRDLV